jgi:hypothetical protein
VSDHLVWSKGGTASFLTIAVDAVTLRSSIPAPPGSPLEATFAADPAVSVTVKIHGSKLQPDGSFTLKGRLIEGTRALRARIEELIAGA